MKISELQNCPSWLSEAETSDADVSYNPLGHLTWHGGVWHGGVWHGGDWLGGVWHGGVWLGGVWHGGVWLGGDWLGGVWHGGVWHGGVWHGGVWLGGVWHGGVWLGESCKNNLLNVLGLRWPITISDTRMQIGCELHPFEEWSSFDDAKIVSMDRGALKFWRVHKVALLAICASRQTS